VGEFCGLAREAPPPDNEQRDQGVESSPAVRSRHDSPHIFRRLSEPATLALDETYRSEQDLLHSSRDGPTHYSMIDFGAKEFLIQPKWGDCYETIAFLAKVKVPNTIQLLFKMCQILICSPDAPESFESQLQMISSTMLDMKDNLFSLKHQVISVIGFLDKLLQDAINSNEVIKFCVGHAHDEGCTLIIDHCHLKEKFLPDRALKLMLLVLTHHTFNNKSRIMYHHSKVLRTYFPNNSLNFDAIGRKARYLKFDICRDIMSFYASVEQEIKSTRPRISLTLASLSLLLVPLSVLVESPIYLGISSSFLILTALITLACMTKAVEFLCDYTDDYGGDHSTAVATWMDLCGVDPKHLDRSFYPILITLRQLIRTLYSRFYWLTLMGLIVMCSVKLQVSHL
jgi:hypothetical protein